MLKSKHIFVTLFLLTLSATISADTLTDRFTPGTQYYFSDFNPGQQPWKPGQHLNIEEVFKNYQYYMIVFGQDGKSITVNKYLRGNRQESENYLVLPDNSLQKK